MLHPPGGEGYKYVHLFSEKGAYNTEYVIVERFASLPFQGDEVEDRKDRNMGFQATVL